MFEGIQFNAHNNKTTWTVGEMSCSMSWDHNVQTISRSPVTGTKMWGYRFSNGVMINSYYGR